MKKLIKDYAFIPGSKQIIFAELFSLEDLLLITNVTTNEIVYNFAGTGGSLDGYTLTLDFDTTSMNAADKLQIFADVQGADQQALTDEVKSGLVEIVRELRAMKQAYGFKDSGGRMKVNVDAGTVAVSTVSTLSNITSAGGYQVPLQTLEMTNAGAQNLRKGIVIS